jgi:glycine betaine/proline transport system substrate-binding protein
MILLLCLAVFATWTYSPAYAKSKSVTLGLEDWSSEIASHNVVKAVLQKRLGVRCILKRMSVSDQYAAVSDGSIDAIVGSWLPAQSPYYDKFKGQFEDLGPNLKGAKLGLVVPQVSSTWLLSQDASTTEPYMVIDSIEELNDHYDDFGGKIIGIEEDSGMMRTMREKLIPAYGLEDFELIPGNEVTMTAQLADAIKKQRWIVVLGWTPHWKFGRWNLKFLKDPKNIWGEAARIHSLARKGLKEDMPDVYDFLDTFRWTPKEMEQLLIWNEMKDTPFDNAIRWMNYNKERVNSWVE